MAYLSASEKALDDNELAIAIQHGLFGSHLGVAFKNEDDQPKLLHLAFHKRLLVEDYPPEDALWAISRIEMKPDSAAQARALLCGMSSFYKVDIGRSDQGSISFGLNLLAGLKSIHANGEYIPVDGSDGYTCASIIAAIFEGIGFPLVSIDTWKPTEINLAWGRGILCLLRATGAPSDHIEIVEKNNCGLRLMPEEVAAASEIDQSKRPAKHDDVKHRANDVFKEMLVLCGPPQPIGDGNPVKHCVDTFDNERKTIAIGDLIRYLKVIADKGADSNH